MTKTMTMGSDRITMTQWQRWAQMGCENTAEATVAGLAAGMTAVELDISMSQDKVSGHSVMWITWVRTRRCTLCSWHPDMFCQSGGFSLEWPSPLGANCPGTQVVLTQTLLFLICVYIAHILLHNGDIGTCILDTDENTLHFLAVGGFLCKVSAGQCLQPLLRHGGRLSFLFFFSPFTLNVICLLSYTSSLHLKVFEKIRENFKYANSSGVDQQVWSCFENENVEMCYDDAKFWAMVKGIEDKNEKMLWCSAPSLWSPILFFWFSSLSLSTRLWFRHSMSGWISLHKMTESSLLFLTSR